MSSRRSVCACCAAALALAACSRQDEQSRTDAAATAASTAAQSAAAAAYPTRVFFGDTHLHTAMSMDAGAFGNRLGIEDAYRFAPTFLVSAMKDPESAHLDRVQIVKGWVDASGARQEKMYDVAWSGDRQPGADGKLPAVGNTVDVSAATYTNSIGAAELSAVWPDPEFDPALRAVYYVRVLEIPTPRWPAYDAVRFKIRMPKSVKRITQERAYTSPIWYSP